MMRRTLTVLVGLALLVGLILTACDNGNGTTTGADATATFGAAEFHAQLTAQPQPNQPHAQGVTR